MMPYPPLGTLYAAAVVRDAGYSVALFDAMLSPSEEEVYDHLVRHEPRFLVIYDDDFNYLTKMCLTRMREAACRSGRRPSVAAAEPLTRQPRQRDLHPLLERGLEQPSSHRRSSLRLVHA